MDTFDSLITSISEDPRNSDDFANRLSSRYSVLLLIVFATATSFTQYVGNPITCWVPVHFTGSHTKYTNNYCWVSNTYYLPYEADIPKPDEDRQMIPYYQWIPLILLGQALFFYLPNVIWKTFNGKSGVDSDDIVEAADNLSKVINKQSELETLDMVVSQIDEFLSTREEKSVHCDISHIVSATCCRLCSRRMGNYLVMFFIFSKMLFIANLVAQLFVMSRILATTFYHMDFIRNMMPDHDWTESEYVTFPRVTMCDLEVRRLGNLHRYTVQCVLPLNLYTEKMYIFLWFWMIFVLVVSIYSLMVWVAKFIFSRGRRSFVQNKLAKFRPYYLQKIDTFMSQALEKTEKENSDKLEAELKAIKELSAEKEQEIQLSGAHEDTKSELVEKLHFETNRLKAEARDKYRQMLSNSTEAVKASASAEKAKFQSSFTEAHLKNFVNKYLAQDGVLLLRLIDHNTDSLATVSVTGELWNRERRKRDSSEQQSALTGAVVDQGKGWKANIKQYSSSETSTLLARGKDSKEKEQTMV